jgi:hypothetical protein
LSAYKEIKECRISQDSELISVLNLGNQALTGIFPKDKDQAVTEGPLELIWCKSSGLLQLKHSYEPSEMYGDNYGYRSGLNQSMVEHLNHKVNYLERLVFLQDRDTIVDIGSNDCTTLKAYKNKKLNFIGIDPTGHKFSHYYPKNVRLISDFFSSKKYSELESKKARIITSIAMFYDLESPVKFAQEIESILADDGIWHFEQSYMPAMLRMNSYDTICHEHLEYYSLGVINLIMKQAGLKLVDVTMNSINGGSFAVTVTKKTNQKIKPNEAVISWLLEQEERMGINTIKPYNDFKERVFRHREDLIRLIRRLNADGKKILGYGASTKGNVVLQFCGLNSSDIPAIAEVNPEKFNCLTPGSHIPIISEIEAKNMRPDYFLVLPWHFRDSILKREKQFLTSGGKFIFPFPEIEII